jgi:hypothetical protein
MSTEFEAILKQIQDENKNTKLPEVPAKVLDAEEERVAAMSARMDKIETGMTDVAQLLHILVHGAHANQFTSQTFSAPKAPTPAPQIQILEPQLTRVFPFVVGTEKKGFSQSAHVSFKPVPNTMNTWHNPSLFTPGQISHLYAMYTENPTEFAKNLVESYQASIPYQYKKKS